MSPLSRQSFETPAARRGSGPAVVRGIGLRNDAGSLIGNWLVVSGDLESTVLTPESQSAPLAGRWNHRVAVPRTESLRTAAHVWGLPSLVWLSCLGLLLASYSRWFSDIVQVITDGGHHDDGFAVLVPLIVLGCCWRGYRSTGSPIRRRVHRRCVIRGAALVSMGIIFHLAAWWTRFLLLDAAALSLILHGCLWLLGGARAARGYRLAATCIVFVAPWPPAWQQLASVNLQHFVSLSSSLLMDVLGLPVLCEGNLLRLPGETLVIAEGCSGIRQIGSFLVISTLLAGLNRLPAWSALTLILSSLPVAVLGNCLRVVLTAVTLMFIGREAAQGVFHWLEGLVLVAVSSLLLLGIATFLKRKSQTHAKLHGGDRT